MNSIRVSVPIPGREYHIHIDPGGLGRVGAELAAVSQSKRVTVISDETVTPLYAEILGRSLLAAGIEYTLLTIPAGEASKSLDVAAQIFGELATGRHARTEPIIALGGGVVGDLAGFVAATWHRGAPLVHCPTTLEAMIDASIGGKTAVNLSAGKNLVGAFHQPILVCADTNCLLTLSDRDYRAGLAESVKHAIVSGDGFLEWHDEHAEAIRAKDAAIAAQLVGWNCRIKAGVVVADEREQSTTDVGRAALNFGHTIGHAIEAASNYALRHGEAVAWGMIAEMDLAVRLCGFPDADRLRIERLLRDLVLTAPPTFSPSDIIPRLWSDKKVRNENLRFAVPHALGRMQWLEAPTSRDLEDAISRIRA